LLIALLLAVGLPLANAQQGSGKPYGARDPHTCDSKKAPANGAISVAQAIQYFNCDMEALDGVGHLSQVADVKIEIGKGHAFNIYLDSHPGIDVSQPVYDIRGSFTSGYCSVIDGSLSLTGEIDPSRPVYPVRGTYDAYTCWNPTYDGTTGKNCNVRKATPFEGACYRTTFGDWSCRVRGTSFDLNGVTANVPPPK